jgi:hypothetical protein
VSNLILPAGVQASRPSRTARRAAAAGQPKPQFPNMQRIVRKQPQITSLSVTLSPAGPVLIVGLNGQPVPIVLQLEQARNTGVGLISAAANYELLQNMQEQEADGQPVQVNEATAAELLAEAQANVDGEIISLKGDEFPDEDEDDEDLILKLEGESGLESVRDEVPA